MFLPYKVLERKLQRILTEDIGQGDITTAAVVAPGTLAKAEIVSKEQGILAGVEEAETLLKSLNLTVEVLAHDGEKIQPKQVLMNISGDCRAILSTERTILNILSRMSGIATATRNAVEKLSNAQVKTRIACTRKTAPGLLYFDKKAVSVGGGDTHRLHLDDMILIKDNHITVAGGVVKAVKKAKEQVSLCKKIEVEVTKAKDVVPAIRAGADIIMLDNFSAYQVKQVVKMLKRNKLYGKVLLEASGGITNESVLEFAKTGVDLVSLGELTDSPRVLDMSLEIIEVEA